MSVPNLHRRVMSSQGAPTPRWLGSGPGSRWPQVGPKYGFEMTWPLTSKMALKWLWPKVASIMPRRAPPEKRQSGCGVSSREEPPVPPRQGGILQRIAHRTDRVQRKPRPPTRHHWMEAARPSGDRLWALVKRSHPGAGRGCSRHHRCRCRRRRHRRRHRHRRPTVVATIAEHDVYFQTTCIYNCFEKQQQNACTSFLLALSLNVPPDRPARSSTPCIIDAATTRHRNRAPSTCAAGHRARRGGARRPLVVAAAASATAIGRRDQTTGGTSRKSHNSSSSSSSSM